MSQASYKSRSLTQAIKPKELPKTYLLAAAGIALALATIFSLLPTESASANQQSNEIALNFTAMASTPEQPTASDSEPEAEDELQWQTETVRSGDNLTTIFKRASLGAADVYKLATSGEHAKVLTRMRPGEELALGFDSDRLLAKVEYKKNRLESYLFKRNENGFSSEHIILEPEIFTAFREGEIENSLFLAGEQANLAPGLIMELANIFGWDIDFVFDIRKGDRFSLIYEEKFLDGEKIGDGSILAAEFVNQGKTYRAVRYQHENGQAEYYTPDGLSMRKEFLRAPLDVFRISSHFNLRRKHPIHKKIKAHRGVDYAAPRGTPVYAAGNGKVIASGYSKANGNYVFIQHGQKYITKYLHLNKRHVRKGQTVTQRKVIGTVGSTGYATGPHLHYEFLVNGVHRNPRTVDLPQARPIDKSIRTQFDQSAERLLAKLDSYSQGLRLAMAGTADASSQ